MQWGGGGVVVSDAVMVVGWYGDVGWRLIERKV